MRNSSTGNPAETLATRYRAVRARTLELAAPLSAEDMMVQSCPEASPTKWHLAHTAWFFESFVLTGGLAGYRLFHPDYPWLFNSYYRSFNSFPDKRLRASFSRPGLDEVLRYRSHADEALARLLAAGLAPEQAARVELGLNHEEQHQELILTDILHALFTNPLRPAYRAAASDELLSTGAATEKAEAAKWIEFPGGLLEAGHQGANFCFDNELPRHKVWLEPYRLASRLVTHGEFAEFLADGGYQRAGLWLSDGWNAVERNGWTAPLYWRQAGDGWRIFTLRGELSLEAVRNAPACCLSFYEAEAYARWAGARLATEFEWEAAAEQLPVEGNLLESGRLTTVPFGGTPEAPEVGATCAVRRGGCTQCYGDAWEWTASAYLGYPGFQPSPGALGEYNGKFMSGQMVLRGGSFATPAGHIRPSYRNFWAPETRYQFAGIRLAAHG